MKNKFFSLILVIFILANLTSCTKFIPQNTEDTVQTKDESTNENEPSNTYNEIDKLFLNEFKEEKFNGYVLISKEDKIVFEKSYGIADNEKQIPITNETTFDIASLTKQFTSVSIMMLEEQGLLSTDDTIDNYILDFPHGEKITIHHLLTHTSGVPNDPTEFDLKQFRPNSENTDNAPTEIKLHFEPGESFEYSSPGYILLGYIIENVSGKSLDDFFEDNIFKPLGMNNTSFKDENLLAANLAIGYDNLGKDKAEPSIYDTDFTIRGGGGLCSSAHDLLIWNDALYPDKILSKESIDKIFTPYKNNYGYGYFINKHFDGSTIYEHYGTGAGYRSYILRRTKDKICIIILSNYQDSSIEKLAETLKHY